jgi:hypothetical protein
LRQDVRTLSEMVDPSGQLPVFDGAAWISRDGRYWWNGTAWQPVVTKRRPNFVLIGVAIAIIALIAFVIYAYPRPIVDTTQYGVTNARIDSSTQIEFDYRAQDTCNTLTFVYTFYDAQGIKVDEFQDEQQSQVAAGKSYHFTITAGQPIDASATRFTASPTCHD